MAVQIAQGELGGDGGVLVPPTGQNLALQNRDLSGVDIDGADWQAFVANGAMVGDFLQPWQQLEAGGKFPLRVVEQRLDQ